MPETCTLDGRKVTGLWLKDTFYYNATIAIGVRRMELIMTETSDISIVVLKANTHPVEDFSPIQAKPPSHLLLLPIPPLAFPFLLPFRSSMGRAQAFVLSVSNLPTSNCPADCLQENVDHDSKKEGRWQGFGRH